MLQFISQPFGGPGQFGSTSWVRVIETESGTKESELEATRDGEIRLTRLEEDRRVQGSRSRRPSRKPGWRARRFPGFRVGCAEMGKVYVGKLMQKRYATGQPIELSFKAIVDEMSSDSEPAE